MYIQIHIYNYIYIHISACHGKVVGLVSNRRSDTVFLAIENQENDLGDPAAYLELGKAYSWNWDKIDQIYRFFKLKNSNLRASCWHKHTCMSSVIFCWKIKTGFTMVMTWKKKIPASEPVLSGIVQR